MSYLYCGNSRGKTVKKTYYDIYLDSIDGLISNTHFPLGLTQSYQKVSRELQDDTDYWDVRE
jgi:hypothetical protein